MGRCVNPLLPILWTGLLALAALTASCGSVSSPPAIPATVVGSWSGSARIVNDWVTAEELFLSLEIDADGSVSGQIGDAVLENGRLERNRGGLGRFLRVKTDWVVTANLRGELIAAETIRRPSIDVLVNLEEGRLVGGLHSSGRKLGTDSRIVSATDLTLERAPE